MAHLNKILTGGRWRPGPMSGAFLSDLETSQKCNLASTWRRRESGAFLDVLGVEFTFRTARHDSTVRFRSPLFDFDMDDGSSLCRREGWDKAPEGVRNKLAVIWPTQKGH
jgi:hypothetical protein